MAGRTCGGRALASESNADDSPSLARMLPATARGALRAHAVGVGPAAGLNESQRPMSRLGSAEQACIEQAATAVVVPDAVAGRLRLVAGRLGLGGKEACVENSFVAADA